ncbi:unnamed protein product [Paramecium octaurelia]|uniref:Uncharacterized protein n=1 Tax=Paramecium octaurelia TaxID=43137 RepID=A0A8S1WPS3_PAROT|nr:unnamed protein product [Paramecium octaurelia]
MWNPTLKLINGSLWILNHGDQDIYECPPNNLIEFQVGIWKLDSWDMEGFEIYANDVQIENLKLNFPDGTMICRNEIWKDLLQPLSFKLQIAGTDLTIKLKDNIQTDSWLEDLLDESWGFRDFILRLAIPCVYLYSECNYTGALFQICQGENLNYKTKFLLKSNQYLWGLEYLQN